MDKNSKTLLKRYVKTLESSTKLISITDLGAGSKKLGAERKVCDIAKFSGSRGKYGRLLYNLCRYFEVKKILELGTSVGVGTAAMRFGASTAEITTIDACGNTQQVAIEHWAEQGVTIDKAIHTSFSDHILGDLNVYDFIYIDGHHDGDALQNYINLLQKNCTNETVILVDDIHWSQSMQNAWTKLIKDQRFNVSIELFRMGFLIQRQEQRKEHFILKY
jgi:predicted O-methyltransferase YrrM